MRQDVKLFLVVNGCLCTVLGIGSSVLLGVRVVGNKSRNIGVCGSTDVDSVRYEVESKEPE